MRYHALACDYDGTIAWDGKVDAATIAALETVRDSGRKLLLVTGRELDDLAATFPRMDLFDRIVAENGAVVYCPATREQTLLAQAPPKEFAEALMVKGVERISVGQVIVATWEPHETTALEVIRELGLELQVIFNKGAVMILPSGINKSVGLVKALADLGLSPHNVVGVGDAENDHAFLSTCECSVAVANALDTVKKEVDWVTDAGHGEGVQELIRVLLATDLVELEDRLHHKLVLGKQHDGAEFTIKPYGTNVLICGTSGSGKSTFATALLERLTDLKYQFLVIDPEGDYTTLENAIALGDHQRPPTVEEVLDVISKVDQNSVVNLTGVGLKDRPKFFESVLVRAQELRTKTGRPHWLFIDEAHHVFTKSRNGTASTFPRHVYGLLLVTLEPDSLPESVLASVDLVIAVGDKPEELFANFANVAGAKVPPFAKRAVEKGEAFAWLWRSDISPFRFRVTPPHSERKRHQRKYAAGELPPEQSFYFRGPEGKLNIRSQNLNMFLQIADGVDDETWLHHLRSGDIVHWFRNVIKDPALADEAQRVAADINLSAMESRKQIRELVEQRYILAA